MKYKAILLSAVIVAAAFVGGCSSGGSGNTKASDTPQSSAAEESAVQQSEEESSVEQSNAEQSTETSDESSAESQPAGTPVDASWFNDAVFIGDSVTLKLSYYADNGDLGETVFLCAGSLGYNNSLWDIDHEDNVHPVYNGEKVTIFDGVERLKPKKIFVMMGMNDIGLYGVDDTIDAMKTVTDKLAEKCPDSVIYIESVTPMVSNSSLGDLNNDNIRAFDEKLKEVCAEKGYKYLDVYSAVSDENGDLVYEYCGDPPTDDNPNGMGLHFTDEGCKIWADYLKANVQ